MASQAGWAATALAMALSTIAASAGSHSPTRSRRSAGLVTATGAPEALAPGTSGVAETGLSAALISRARVARVSSLARLAPMELVLSSPAAR